MPVGVEEPAWRPERAVFMALLRAQKINVPNAFFDMTFKEETLNAVPEIRSKNVITGIRSCPAFAMYFSNKCGSVGFLSGWRPLLTFCA